MPKVYLDHHTATPPLPSSIDAMLPFLRDRWGDVAAPHQMGQELIAPCNNFSETILDGLGASANDRFCFFHSRSEAIHNLYLSHYLDHIRSCGRNHILTTNVEEPCILAPLKQLEDLGCHGKTLAVNEQGQLTGDALEKAINPRTSLLSMSWANGLTGVIHPIADIADMCKAKDILLHVDASYVIGKLYFRFEDLPIDYLTFDGSFLHAPKGTAGLVMKSKAPFSSLPSEISVGGVAALSQAIEESERMFDHLCLETARLRAKFEKGIVEQIPDAQVLFQKVDRLPNCSAIAFPGVQSDALLFLLHRKGIYASIGGGHSQKLSQVLVASGIDEVLAQSALNFSLSFETSEKEIDLAIRVIVESVQNLKSLSVDLMGEIR